MITFLIMRDVVIVEDAGKPLIPVAWSLFCLACVIVCLRVWTRLVYLGNRIAIHDWLMILAIVSSTYWTDLAALT